MLAPLIALAAQAAAPPPSELAGIWEGTVGNLPVRACFVQRDEQRFGAYYYQSRQQLIGLEAEEASSTGFRELGGTPGPRWQIESAGATQLTARWTNGGRTLPIRLARRARMVGEESPCGSIAFHRPRVQATRTVIATAVMDGTAYRRLTLDTRNLFNLTVETFALNGAGAAERRINAALARPVAGDPPGWFECIHDSLQYNLAEGYAEQTLRPAMIGRRWLSVASHWDGWCGGPHPDTINSWQLYDRATGREIDLFGWLNAAAVSRQGEFKLFTPALRTVILAGWRPREAPECVAALRSNEEWTVGLTRRGLIFYPRLSRTQQSCAEFFIVPFGRLARFLTPQGAAHVRALLAEAAPAPAARPR